VYDLRGRAVRRIDALGHHTDYSYDVANQVTATTDRDGRTITYAYDDLGRPTTETWVGTNQVIHYGYDADSNLTAVADAFSSLAYTYDNRNRIKTASNAGTPDTPTVVLTYGYDAAGNVLSLADTVGGQAGGLNSYRYDALNHMTQVTQTGAGLQDK